MKVIIISGATATGKTDLAIKLAKRFQLEIVNFDSLLFYQELNIGTAKPSSKERQEIRHHLIDLCSIKEPLNAADYARAAHDLISKRFSSTPFILVGGSGFYLQALLMGMYESSSTDSELLHRSENLYQQEGIAPFIQILKEHDPEIFQFYHENDHYRLRRAVEHWWMCGTKMSTIRKDKKLENLQLSKGNRWNWDLLHVYLDIPRTEHFEIIKKRTSIMLESGLVDEVKKLLSLGFTGAEKPLGSIGYKETMQFIRGEIETQEELSDKISISTRQLAKAQRTWFNRIKDKNSFHPIEGENEILALAEKFLA